jgi:hypothetical protein
VNDGTTPQVNPQAESFYAGALARIRRFMLALAVGLILLAFFRFSPIIAAGFALGCIISYLNFYWLKKAVSGLADRVTASEHKPSSRSIVRSFLLRYVLVALAAYAIFKISRASLYGLLAGLFLPVAAIVCEAAYELYAALRRGY